MTGRRLLPKIGMRYKVLYILEFLLCANSLFLQIECAIITFGDKWFADRGYVVVWPQKATEELQIFKVVEEPKDDDNENTES